MTPDRNTALLESLRRSVSGSSAFSDLLHRLNEGAVEVTGASPEARALILSTLQKLLGRRLAIIVPTEHPDLETALRLFHPDPGGVANYPTPSLSPYQDVPPSLAVIRDEIRALGRVAAGDVELLIIPVRALFRRVPSASAFTSRILKLSKGAELDLRATLEMLVENGFTRTDLVGEIGELAFRGGILDLFPPNEDQPIRLELFGDTVDSIRRFDPETQRSANEIESVSVYPMTQFPLTKGLRTTLGRRLSLDFNDPIYKRDLAAKIEALSEHATFPGIEKYLPLAGDSVAFADYLDPAEWDIVITEPGEIDTSIDKFDGLLRSEYDVAVEKGKAVYAPDRLLVPSEEVDQVLGRARLSLSSLHVTRKGFSEFRLRAPSVSRYVNRLTDFASDVVQGHNEGKKQLFFIATRGGREKVERLFHEFNIPFAENPTAIGGEIAITDGELPWGFDFEPARLTLYSEWDLFEHPDARQSGRPKRRATEAFLTDLRDLKVGDFIVHVDHGVGRFKGLQRIPFGTTEREVMEIEYGDSGKLLLPMESLNLIQKYSGGADTAPTLHKLGGTSWARTKAGVKKAMRDMADELLKLYATRQMITGHAFGADTPWQQEFEEAFEFDETDDQLTAIEDVKGDMESRKPMDRLLCGDVGYGKTEVAMRAGFKAVMDGKQVALLAPTTILAYQHYRTFLRRFASFPVTIELISRFRSPKEQKEIVRKVTDGEIDIVVGTHRILSKDLQFKDMGLLVIDEEQRFGVAQKERLKQFKKAVDVLSMSATPIPRTLHMSMVGVRDISVIETPPKDRLAIQTAVVPFNDELIKEAIEFELARGGQVFFVHNRVDSIYAMQEYLEKLVPGLRVMVGHGQMDEQELEKSMMAFIARDYDLLLATTIIENGIDIPTCNTILIAHAERFGLSQLYQLRGRVGRSDRLAFCYLLIPSERVLSSDARKRLAAIQEFSDLGAGFRIAARDLEIRGSGNLLGGEQSGQIATVGFEMYCKLLEETVRELKGEPIEERVDTTLNLGVDIYIPKDYISDENLRMIFYKRIASARDAGRLTVIQGELRDRFGALPESVERLLLFVSLKTLAEEMGVISIAREGPLVAMKFHPKAKIDPNKLLGLLQESSQAKFSPNGVLSIPFRESGSPLVARVHEVLQNISATA
ncbi:MAG TPA: transcription-repair coupling factor [Thermoanaerobaculia bacterium]|nr:transcription-repair coupling factor [Thermoanaerobaculia bacterium]